MLLYFPQTLSQQQKTCFHLSNHRWGARVKITLPSNYKSRFPVLDGLALNRRLDLPDGDLSGKRVDSQPQPIDGEMSPPKIPKQTRQCFAVPTPDITCPIKLSDVSEIWEICVSTAWRWLKMLKLWHEAHEMAGIPLSFPKTHNSLRNLRPCPTGAVKKNMVVLLI